MSNIIAIPRDRRTVGAALIARLGASLRAHWEEHRRAAELCRAIRMLHNLDDHLLRDVGITRGDIEARVRGEGRRW